jgi:hypothetical protein
MHYTRRYILVFLLAFALLFLNAQNKQPNWPNCNPVITIDSYFAKHPVKVIRPGVPDSLVTGFRVGAIAFPNLSKKHANELRKHIQIHARLYNSIFDENFKKLIDTVCFYAPTHLDSVLITAYPNAEAMAIVRFVFHTNCNPQLFVDSMLQNTAAHFEEHIQKADGIIYDIVGEGHTINSINQTGLNKAEHRRLLKAIYYKKDDKIEYNGGVYHSFARIACNATKHRLISMQVTQTPGSTHLVDITFRFE